MPTTEERLTALEASEPVRVIAVWSKDDTPDRIQLAFARKRLEAPLYRFTVG